MTVTHPDMKRYFMTIPEAGQLVMQAGAMGNGGEIFVLNMGEAVKIKDLAEQMITLSGLKPYEDIAIVYSGARPGEKMSEELMNSGEAMGTTRHPKILIGQINHADDAKVAGSGRAGRGRRRRRSRDGERGPGPLHPRSEPVLIPHVVAGRNAGNLGLCSGRPVLPRGTGVSV